MTVQPPLLAVCTVAPWPVLDGYSLRVSHILRGLADRWSIVLISPPAETLPPWIATHIPLYLSGSGFTYPWRFDDAPIRAAVAQAVHGHRPEHALVWPGAEAVWFGRNDLPRAVADIVDCNPLEFARGFLHYTGLRQRIRALREVAVAALYARRIARAFAATVCVGQADALWQRRIGGAPVDVVPNGVEVPPEAALTPESPTPTLTFTGSLDYRPNIEAVLYAADTIWPRVLAEVPAARFVVAGRDPVAAIRALSMQPGIEIRPNVADMTQVLGEAWVAIAPMRSGVGIKNKVLESWACARPAVLTPMAANGLIVPPDHAGLVRTDPRDLAAAVLALFRDPERRHALGRSARENVSRHFTWAGAADRFDALLRNAR